MTISISNSLENCPKCGKNFYDVDEKDIKWTPNGRKYKVGMGELEAYDPVPIRGTCCYCHTVVEFEELRKEKVEFT